MNNGYKSSHERNLLLVARRKSSGLTRTESGPRCTLQASRTFSVYLQQEPLPLGSRTFHWPKLHVNFSVNIVKMYKKSHFSTPRKNDFFNVGYYKEFYRGCDIGLLKDLFITFTVAVGRCSCTKSTCFYALAA